MATEREGGNGKSNLPISKVFVDNLLARVTKKTCFVFSSPICRDRTHPSLENFIVYVSQNILSSVHCRTR